MWEPGVSLSLPFSLYSHAAVAWFGAVTTAKTLVSCFTVDLSHSLVLNLF